MDYDLDDGQAGVEWALDHLEYLVWAPVRECIEEAREASAPYDYGSQGTRYQALPEWSERQKVEAEQAMREAMRRWREIRGDIPHVLDADGNERPAWEGPEIRRERLHRQQEEWTQEKIAKAKADAAAALKPLIEGRGDAEGAEDAEPAGS